MDQFERSTVRSEISEAVLLSFSTDPTLANNLILEGSGALHFVYDSPRHTSDLDFLLPNHPWIYNKIWEALKREIQLHDDTLFARVKAISDRLIEGWYSYHSNLHRSVGVTVEIKVGNVKGLQYQTTEGKFSPLLVEIPSQIFAKKILATLLKMKNRGNIKSTDLFDLEYLADNLGVLCTLDEIRKTARSYCEEEIITQELIQRVVDYIEDPSNYPNFVNGIKATLLPKVATRYCFDEEYFQRRADHFRQYLES